VVIALILLVGLQFGFSLMILKGRDSGGFLPLRDYAYYIASETALPNQSGANEG
jgi:hypothetical protein